MTDGTLTNSVADSVRPMNCHCVQRPAPPLTTLADTTVASSGTCHCYPKWYDFPVNIQVFQVRGMVKNLPLLRGARCSLFSEAGIAAPASCRSYCIFIYSQTNSRLLFPSTERRTVSQYKVLLPIILENKSLSH